MARNSARGDDLTDKIGIVEGPSGIGKTRVIGMTAVIRSGENRESLVVAETRYTVRIAAEAIFNAMIIARLQQRRVFVIKHVDTVVGMSSDIEETYKDEDEVGALRGPQNKAAQNPLSDDHILGVPGGPRYNAADPQIRMSETSRGKIRHGFKKRLGR